MSNGNSAEASTSPSPAPSSIGNSAPKYGTLVPNRVFVGGISANTTEQDLLDLFTKYGKVKATKVISDRAGVSKGYGFVTFETEDEARKLTQEADNIMLKDRKLNIAPAVKKQVSDLGYIKPYSPRLVDGNAAPAVIGSNGTVFFGNGTTYAYPNPMSMLTSEYHHQTISTGVPQGQSSQHPATFPTQQAPQTTHAAVTLPSHHPVVSHSAASQYHTQFMYPQPLYFPQQYQSPVVQPQWATAAASPHWRWVSPASYGQPTAGYISADGLFSQAAVPPSAYMVPDRTY